MLIASVENTPESLFTAVFELYNEPREVYVTSEAAFQPSLTDEVIRIQAVREKAERVRKGVLRAAGNGALQEILTAHRSGEAEKDVAIFRYLLLLFREGKPGILNPSRPAVIAFQDVYSRVTLEAHRMKGFLRFQQTEEGVYFAEVQPDHNILELIMPHFFNRYRDMRFLIYDSKRGIVGISDTKKYRVFASPQRLTANLSLGERQFQRMYKHYYDRISIAGRKNLRLMRRCMPVRYHKYMPEKDELL